MDAADKTPIEPTDRAYLLRCWRDGAAWRFSLEPVDVKSLRRGFATLDALAAFLREELESTAKPRAGPSSQQ